MQNNNAQESDDQKVLRLQREEIETSKAVKRCPFCDKYTYLDGGCNYMNCSIAEPPSQCSGEWCWQCEKPKYKIINHKPSLGFCNDSNHNSH